MGSRIQPTIAFTRRREHPDVDHGNHHDTHRRTDNTTLYHSHGHELIDAGYEQLVYAHACIVLGHDPPNHRRVHWLAPHKHPANGN